MRRLNKKEKGITLVVLVVTIIVLLILAGITINLIIGDNGLITRAKSATEEYEKATKKEKEKLENLYGSIQIADDDNAEITINMKELKDIIDERVNEAISRETTGINANSLLMTSTNTKLSAGQENLTSFTNTFTDGEFEKYFEYNSSNGEITCKEGGWFLIETAISVGNKKSDLAILSLLCFVNEIRIMNSYGAENGNGREYDCNTTNIYLKKGDKLTFRKESTNSNDMLDNYARVVIRKN